MENIESDLKESELKQSTLRKAYDCLHTHATSLAVFSVQWKDLEDQFESTRLSIEARLRELKHQEEEVRAKTEQLEIKESKVSSEMESKSNSLQVLQKLVDEKKNRLLSLQSLIREHSNAVIVQEKRLVDVEGFVREKERECDLIERRVEQRTKKLNSVERSVEDMALKERELRKVLGSMEARKAELDLREGALKSEKMSIQDCDKELKVKAEKLCLEEQDICLRRKSMVEWSCKLELKEKEIELKEKQVKESREEGEKHLDTLSRGLQTKENKLRYRDREIELKRRELISIKRSTEEHTQNLKLEERRLENQAKELELKQKELDSIKKSTEERTQYLKSKERRLEDQAKELELKQNKLYSIRKSTEEYNQKLKSKERQLEGQIKELELKQKEFDWIRKENTENLKSKERQLEEQSKELKLTQQKIETIEKSIEEQALNLKLKERQLEEQANQLGLKQKECDSITKPTEEHMENLNSKENTGVLHCQVKIEQLEHLSVNNAIVPSSASNQSSIDRDVRGLQLNDHLKRYGLVSSDISAILHASSDPAKFVLDALQGFYPSKSTVDNSVSDCDLTVIRRSCIHLLENMKSISPHISPQVREEAIKLAGEWKARVAKGAENCLEVLGFMRLVTAYEITSAYDTNGELQSLIPDLIQRLIEKKLFIEAVRWICMFELTDKFPPVPLLEEFVENTKRFCRKVGKRKKSLDEKDKVINDQIADLRAVIECIKDCDLEAMYTSRCIESRIASLENLKENRRRVALSKVDEDTKNLKSKESQIEDKARDLKSKQKEFILMKKSLEEQARKLKSKERQLEFQAKELELKRKEFDSNKKSTEEHIQNLQSKENYSIPHSQVKMQQLDCIPPKNVVVPSFASNQPSINWDGIGQKRSTPTYDHPGFQPQQQRETKYPRTSESAVPPYPVQNFNPGFPQPRPPSSWQHHGQFGMATNNCEIGAYSSTGFGAIPTPGVHYSQPYRPTPPINSGPFEPV